MFKPKYISLMVTALFICSMLPLVYAADEPITDDEGYIIDQMQTDEGGWYAAINSEYSAAQSFIPSMSPLAKVRLLVKSNHPENPSETFPLKISVRKTLNGPDLTSVIVDKTHVLDEYAWINFDFNDITVQPGTPYYIVAELQSKFGEYWWGMWSSQDIDKYDSGEAWLKVEENGIPRWVNFTDECCDFCFKTYSYTGRTADLACHGVIGLPEQQPGSEVTAQFTVENIGEEESLLHWRVKSCPSWGEWTFTPAEGFDLTPEDGKETVTVTINVPNETNQNFNGEIILENVDDVNDTDSIRITLSTPYAKKGFLQWLQPIQLFRQGFWFLNWFF